jgi:ABC-2 type transport system ATP-binding protein
MSPEAPAPSVVSESDGAVAPPVSGEPDSTIARSVVVSDAAPSASSAPLPSVPAAVAVSASASPPPPARRLTIVVDHVSRWYGNVVAVNDVSVSVGPGVTGLLGPNGAGKSTILHLVAGLLRPSAGSVSVLGAPSWRNPAVYAQIGLVPERENVYAFLTGREFVRLNARLQGLRDPDAATRAAIATVDLEDAADRQIGTYSKGMRQRIKVAAGLVHDPEVLLLDEPFNGMDPRQRLHMMELLTSLAAQGRTILFSSHILEEVERLAQSVLVIVAGRLAASGDFREIRRLMTDRPHTFTIHSSENRRLAAALLARDPVFGVELADGLLTVRAADYAAFTRLVAGVARETGVSLYEVRPTDESLESVFQYLVTR